MRPEYIVYTSFNPLLKFKEILLLKTEKVNPSNESKHLYKINFIQTFILLYTPTWYKFKNIKLKT